MKAVFDTNIFIAAFVTAGEPIYNGPKFLFPLRCGPKNKGLFEQKYRITLFLSLPQLWYYFEIKRS